jgi:lyso-ornithine lipid O-acyltransferase
MRPVYAWYGDMELVPHLWQMVRLGRLTVRVEFHEPVTVEGFGSRKALAEHCWRVIANGVDRAVSGRSQPLASPLPETSGSVPVANAATS